MTQSTRRAALFLLALLLAVSPAAEAKKRRKQDRSKKPAVVMLDDGADPDARKEAVREARERGLSVVVRTLELQGPPALRAPGNVEPLVTGTGYRPVDAPISNPAFDSFPSNFHAEPSIAVSGSSAVCAYNDGGSDATSANPSPIPSTDGFSTSTDGGATWKDQGKRAPTTGFTSFDGDNVVAAGPDGDFYYFSDGGQRNASFSAMACSRSTDGGKTWTQATSPSAGVVSRFSDSFFDKGWIAVDRSQTASRGNVYTVWSDFGFSAGATDLYVARSTDHGQSWLAQKLDSFTHPVAVTYVQTAPNGWVYVGEQDEGTIVNGQFTGTNYVRVSKDGGTTWGPLLSAGPYRSVGDPNAIALCSDPGFFGGLVRYLNGPIEADSSLRLAVDPSDPSGRTVYVVTQAIPDDRPDDESDVYVWRSTDGGASFSNPVRVNDDQTRSDQFMPDIWVAPDGTVGILFLDRRNDTRANWRLEAWMAISRDKGQTWSCNFPVSSQAFPPIGRCQMSDYDGVDADSRNFYLAWGDGRQVDPQAQTTYAIYGAAVPLAGPGPILSLESASGSGGKRAIVVRVRNDGTEAATGLTATLVVDNNLILAPIQGNLPFPDVSACHGVVEVEFRIPYAVPNGVAKCHLTLNGPKGSVTFPFQVIAPTPQLTILGTLLRSDFEAGLGSDWTASAGSLWHVSSTCGALTAGHSGRQVAFFGLDQVCASGTSGSGARVYGGLTSRTLSLPPGTIHMRFNEWVERPTRWSSDHMGLQISTDGGKSFENLWGYGKMSRYTLDPAKPLTDGTGKVSWHPVDLDLSDYSGQDVLLRFFYNGPARGSAGYAIDDVQVFAVSPNRDAGLGTCADPLRLAPEAPVRVDVTANNEASVTGQGDPTSLGSCVNAPTHPYWFEFTPPVSGSYGFTLCGNGTETYTVSLWNDSSCSGGSPQSCASTNAGCSVPITHTNVFAGQKGVPVRFLVTSAGGSNGGTFTFSIVPVVTTQLVPIVLDVTSSNGSYKTELSLTNHARSGADVTLTYTASLGSGSGSVSDTVPLNGQLVLPDVIAYFRSKGLPIPTSGPQAGTLLVTSNGVTATARTLSPTKSPQPTGASSLAYDGLTPVEGDTTRGTIFGLRANAADRSKVAVFNTGVDPVTVKLTARSGSGDGKSTVRESMTLQPYGWTQVEDVLEAAGLTNGYATLERTSDKGTFGAYGVINSNGTNDGSFLPMTVGSESSLVVPVLVETGRFESELVLANNGSSTATFALDYRESLHDELGTGGTVTLKLAAGEQKILPGAIDFLRRNGVAIGARGAASYAGALRVSVTDSPLAQVFAGARTAAPSSAGGSFGLFTPGVPYSQLATDGVVYLDGLRQDETNRTNVAVVNAGTSSDGAIFVEFQLYDGKTGEPGRSTGLRLEPGQWKQLDEYLNLNEIRHGWVSVTRINGSAPWLAYAVVNDGGAPGFRTDDGAYVPMRKAP